MICEKNNARQLHEVDAHDVGNSYCSSALHSSQVMENGLGRGGGLAAEERRIADSGTNTSQLPYAIAEKYRHEARSCSSTRGRRG